MWALPACLPACLLACPESTEGVGGKGALFLSLSFSLRFEKLVKEPERQQVRFSLGRDGRARAALTVNTRPPVLARVDGMVAWGKRYIER